MACAKRVAKIFPPIASRLSPGQGSVSPARKCAREIKGFDEQTTLFRPALPGERSWQSRFAVRSAPGAQREIHTSGVVYPCAALPVSSKPVFPAGFFRCARQNGAPPRSGTALPSIRGWGNREALRRQHAHQNGMSWSSSNAIPAFVTRYVARWRAGCSFRATACTYSSSLRYLIVTLSPSKSMSPS